MNPGDLLRGARMDYGSTDAAGSRVHHFHLTQDDLAERWRISPRTLEAWRWRGLGPGHVKIGGRVRYLLDNVLAYEAAQRRGGQ